MLNISTQRPMASRCSKPVPCAAIQPVAVRKVRSAASSSTPVRRESQLHTSRQSVQRNGVIMFSGAADATATATEGLLELNKDTFYPFLESPDNKDTLVVVDFFTDWCGPCKVIYPELVKYSKEHPEIRIVKFNCNKANKELGVQLAIKVAPTFHLYKNSVKVGEMTGAKFESLVALIEKNA